MSKYTLTIEGDFEKGDCYSCPLSHESYDIDGERVPACAPFERSATCPLEVVAENETTGEQTGWIPTSERMPEKEYDAVLGITDKGYYSVMIYTTEHGFRTSDICCEGELVVAWMPLPEPYKKGGGIDA